MPQQPPKPNPFTPTFGQIPANMAGRDPILREMRIAFDSPSRLPALTTLISGARGSGKTTLLARIAEEAAERGWISITTAALPGMLDDILAQATDKTNHLTEAPSTKSKLTGIGVGNIVNLAWKHDDTTPTNWRLRMQKLIETLEDMDSGLVILVDELDPTIDEVVQLASIYQMFVMESRRVALIMAGLPFQIEKAKNDKRISFVRRAQQKKLGRVADGEVREAMRKTIKQGGRSIDDDALEIAVKAAAGFPFMIQLVGYRMWERSLEHVEIVPDDARIGSELAQEELKSYVFESTYRDLSNGDLAFLEAMLPDDGPSSMKDVASRMGKSSSYASTYRERLLRQGIIGEPDRNAVGFELPGFKDYLIERLGFK